MLVNCKNIIGHKLKLLNYTWTKNISIVKSVFYMIIFYYDAGIKLIYELFRFLKFKCDTSNKNNKCK